MDYWTPKQMANAIINLLPESGLDTAKWTDQEFEDYWKEVVDLLLDKDSE